MPLAVGEQWKALFPAVGEKLHENVYMSVCMSVGPAPATLVIAGPQASAVRGGRWLNTVFRQGGRRGGFNGGKGPSPQV